jgi:TolA-binding protein
MERKSSAAEQDTELLLTEPGRTRPEEKLSVVVDLPPQFRETDGIHGQVRNTISDAPAASGVRDTTVRTASIEPMPSKTGAPSSAPESMEKAGTVVEVEKPASGKNADVTQQRDGSSLESGQPGADPVNREKEASTVTPPPGRNPEFQSQLTDLKACFRIGEQMVESGKYGEAEEAYLAALGFEPNNPEAMNRLGRVYYLQRAYEKASACLAIAISRKPDQSVLADAHYNMGDVLLARGDLDKAMKSYKTAIQINPAYSRRVRSFY